MDLFLIKTQDKSIQDTEAFFLGVDQEEKYLDNRIPDIWNAKILDTTENYLVLSNTIGLDCVNAIMLVSNIDGCIKFTDLYCGIGSLPYIRFDQYENLFYIGSDTNNNYEFIYTII